LDHCAECNFSYDSIASSDVTATLQGLASRFVELLTTAEIEGIARVRPEADVWSALEYACHLRDVLLIQRDRVILALVEEGPGFPRMYRDERVSLAGYLDENIEEVTGELIAAVSLFGKVFGHLSAEQLQRSCIYNFPAPRTRDVAWLGSHTVHEATHHLGDVRSVLIRAANEHASQE